MKSLIKKLLSTRQKFFLQRSACALRMFSRHVTKRLLRRYRDNEKVTKPDYPRTLQLPITYKCNFDCVMCGMRSMIHNKDFSPQELESVLKDALFSKIESVGVNGGEPFLLKNITDYIDVIIKTLPSVKHLYIISNGYFTEELLNASQKIKALCFEKGIKYHLSISIDGYGDMQDTMRGKKGAFEHAVNSCNAILANKDIYCDTFGTICTITKINVYHLAQLEVWAKKNSIPISFNIATVHKRIANEDKYEDFSVYTDPHAQMMAAEFFYSKFLQTKSEYYFGLYYVVSNQKRISYCDHRTGTVTLTPNGAISYCATYSRELGNAFEKSAESIFFDPKNIRYRDKLHCERCGKCSHYSSTLTKEAYMDYFYKERIRQLTL